MLYFSFTVNYFCINMKKITFLVTATVVIISNNLLMPIAQAESSLLVVYPPNNHQTTSDKIFFIGSASSDGQVSINGIPIQRSKKGYFAPSLPLKIGDNFFKIIYKNEEINLKITRTSEMISLPNGIGFAKDSLTPIKNIARLPGELICFSAVAPPEGTVSVQLGQQTIPLFSQSETVKLPPDHAVLTAQTQPISAKNIGLYQGCTEIKESGNLGYPIFQLSLNNQIITQKGTGQIEILSPNQFEVIEVIADPGVTRTGPSTDYSRLTPLPKGTRARVTGKDGNWLRLDYGAWILKEETRIIPNTIPPQSIIRGVSSRQIQGTTEVIFPLESPVPVSVRQDDDKLILTLYNTTAQTDTINVANDPIIKRLDWQQVSPGQIEYIFTLKTAQQWGYDLRYEGTSLILSLRHPPKLSRQLEGVTILLDPGHGGSETGATGPTGYQEKQVNLVVSKLLQQELTKRGATVYITRETDQEVSLKQRVEEINKIKPTLSLSIHYNALPDGGDAMNTSGIGVFWYHPQAYDLSVFLHHYLVKTLNRPSYGVFWKNLALTRPYTTPSILLELGFMTNPDEFEWVTNTQEQEKLAQVIADGIVAWFDLHTF